jgi:hypothetical protein
MGHKTVRVRLKGGDANIDEAIVPVVQWLDSVGGVETFASCQGNNREGSAYAAFVVESLDCLASVLTVIGTFHQHPFEAGVEVFTQKAKGDWKRMSHPLVVDATCLLDVVRFRLSAPSKDAMIVFGEWLKVKGKA